MNKYKLLFRIPTAILIIIYSVGVIGFLAGFETIMMDLTPYTLILSLLLLLITHRRWNRFFVAFMLTIMIAGYVVEVLGVETGWVFGEYAYGETLGYKVFNVPLLIGVNWFVLVYSSGMISNLMKVHWFFRAVIGATLMVLLDVSLEPVAVAYDFWSWGNHVIPVRNYIAWFMTSLIFQMVFQSLKLKKINRFAIILFITQWIFFLILSLTL